MAIFLPIDFAPLIDFTPLIRKRIIILTKVPNKPKYN